MKIIYVYIFIVLVSLGTSEKLSAQSFSPDELIGEWNSTKKTDSLNLLIIYSDFIEFGFPNGNKVVCLYQIDTQKNILMIRLPFEVRSGVFKLFYWKLDQNTMKVKFVGTKYYKDTVKANKHENFKNTFVLKRKIRS